jgi:predicted transcriptional regulator with HTH domain
MLNSTFANSTVFQQNIETWASHERLYLSEISRSIEAIDLTSSSGDLSGDLEDNGTEMSNASVSLGQEQPKNTFKYFFRVQQPNKQQTSPGSSSVGFGSMASECYRRLSEQLTDLAGDGSEDGKLEIGAVKTAESVLSQLRRWDIAPPLLSWHGGDAIVLLWVLGKRTEAITVTDGEIGYVLREDKKTTRLLDSILPELMMLGTKG